MKENYCEMISGDYFSDSNNSYRSSNQYVGFIEMDETQMRKGIFWTQLKNNEGSYKMNLFKIKKKYI